MEQKIWLAFVVDENGNEHRIGKYDTKDEALHFTMLNLYADVGDGDGENGGAGSLWNCAKEIRDVLENGDRYSYVGRSWFIRPADPPPRVFRVAVKSAQYIYWNVEAKSLEEAIQKVEKRADECDWFAEEDWCDPEVGVSEEDSYEVSGEKADF